ncbi:MAG: sterol desaturase family protein [Chitinophagaceae bacterium]|nr:MAG: sterol desaturase family protein [Chitinophagaceae bacterium]
MHWNFIGLAVPLFLFFIGLEYYVSKKRGKNFFQYAESVANLNVGIAERLMDIFVTGLFFFVFQWVHKNFAIFDIKPAWYTWILLFLATDLVWYWYHRFAHEVNAFWAAHVVHHQSEDFNYTVSARITVFQAMIRSGFWSVLPLIGFPPEMITVLLLVHGLYPFFIHTQVLGRWGWFEKVLVTPTHHGIHHASNPEYLDRNYGDVLIIWDKMFGTFKQEDKNIKIVYGLTKQLNSHSFLWQHFHFPMEIFMNFRYARGFRARWKVLFGKPDDLDPRYRAVLERKLLNVHPVKDTTDAMRQYVTAQTTFSLCLLFVIVTFEAWFPTAQLLLWSAFILVSLVNSGAILDQRRWIFYLEYSRLALVMISVLLVYPNGWTSVGLLLATACLLVYFRKIRRYYFRILYRG